MIREDLDLIVAINTSTDAEEIQVKENILAYIDDPSNELEGKAKSIFYRFSHFMERG